MLVLTRKIGEEVIIDGCIRVSVTAINRNQVRIGINAPPDVLVDRGEVHKRRREFVEADLIIHPREERAVPLHG
jgi:carbon storage regulator